MVNRLSDAQSAYLRQHAGNPVDWWPWGSEAFAEAERRDVPVFISIGYAACHWCHVMAHESFEDNDVAALLNERFVSIKVDREEHPEVDDAYMAATQAMTGQGGWPMSVFTLPNGQVFHTGTYFPPQRSGPVPSFTEVLHAVHEAWTQRRDQVEEQAAKIAEALGQQRRRQAELATAVQTDNDDAASSGLTRDSLADLTAQVLAALAAQEDPVHGGFGQAPKFPPSPILGWLLEESAWTLRGEDLEGEPEDPGAHADDRAGGLAIHTMEAMARSALFDQVEGGFARYATDQAWQLPHFEKMLYDNAQLLGAYARLSVHPAAGAETQASAARTARMTIEWLRNRMLTEQGLLASSLDADTVNEDGIRTEGATYLISDEQLVDAARTAGLTESQAQQLAELNRGVPADEHALRSGAPLNITAETPRTIHFDEPLSGADRQLWETVLPQLQELRDGRPQPGRDDKVVAAWNAQAVRSLAEAASLWGDLELLQFAEVLAERLWDVHAEVHHSAPPQDAAGSVNELRAGFASVQGQAGISTKVYRTSYSGARGNGLGTLADHALVASMCFALVSAGADGPTWTDRGASLLSFVLNEFVRSTEADGEDEGIPGAETGTEAEQPSPGPRAGIRVLDSLDADGLLTQVQGGTAEATPVDGPEPSSIAVLAQALQPADAFGLRMQLPWIVPAPYPEKRPAWNPLQPEDLLHHLQLIGPQAPLAVGGSLLAARRAAQGSPAFRIVSGRSEDIAEVRREGTLLGVPVEPVGDGVVGPDQQLQVSICLNGGEAGGVCLPPAGSVDTAIESL